MLRNAGHYFSPRAGDPETQLVRTEVVIRRAYPVHAGRRLDRFRGWRYQVTRWRFIPALTGIEGRVRMGHIAGHTFTRWGAMLRAGKHTVVRSDG